MLRLSLRYQLGFGVILLYVLGTAVVAMVAYRASREALEREALHAAGLAAESRERSLLSVLVARQQRMDAFLASVESLCGERAPNDDLGWERECVRVALAGFHLAEQAVATDLRYGERQLAVRGPRRPPAESPPIGQLARVTASAGRGEYAMQAMRGYLMLRARFPLDALDSVFQDAAGLGINGEVFLTDRNGYFLTSPRFAIPAWHPLTMGPLDQCLRGESGAVVAADYRGVPVISGFQTISALGGGCVVANVSYRDALAPVYRLESLFIWASVALILIGGLVAVGIAGLATRPINRLVASARALAAGTFDRPVPVGGPSEVRHLAQALSSMARSIGDLVQREHTARLDAEAANRAKDDFLAMLSHELRTPLNAILGWASMLGRGQQDPARIAHAARVIERNARAQSRMVEDLLDVSRAAAGTQRLTLSDVSLTAAVDSALEAIRPAADAKGVRLTRSVEVPERVVVVDAQRLQQILWNLLSNAVRFTPAGGIVDISVRDVDGDTELRVSDTGVGISPSFLPHVFERFRQADSSTTRTPGGLGLGLTIVRDLVELHGGAVRAESAGEGHGASFVVRLPAGATVATGAETGARRAASVALRGTRVLVVDDDPDTREVLRTILEDAGAVVTVTRSAPETRAALQSVHPDLLIADIGMPEEDGYSLMRSIRTLESTSERPPVPAIALTAHARPQDVERALASGFQLHVAKPVDSSHLVASVAMLVDTAG
jgi:signal transduction histidine kinase/CheY-like chemotaxis protein